MNSMRIPVVRTFTVAIVLVFVFSAMSGVIFSEFSWEGEDNFFGEIRKYLYSYGNLLIFIQLIWFFSASLILLLKRKSGGYALFGYFLVFSVIDAIKGPFVVEPPMLFLEDLFAFMAGIITALVLFDERICSKRSSDGA